MKFRIIATVLVVLAGVAGFALQSDSGSSTSTSSSSSSSNSRAPDLGSFGR